MNYRLFLLPLITLFQAPIYQETHAFPISTVYAQDNRTKALQEQKARQDASTIQRMDERSKGRVLQQIGGTMVDVTNDINDVLTNAPLMIRQQHATSAVAILNRLVTGVGLGIRAYGRRKVALQGIVSTNEQILEVTIQSYEKLEALSKELEKLLGNKTLQQAVQDVKSQNLTTTQKLQILLSPSNYINALNNFMDDKYITDNKAVRWEKIRNLSKELKEEQAKFDDYMALLQIKFLENMIMSLHLVQNKDAYMKKLSESVTALNAAINLNDKKIQDLNLPNQGGVVNKIKKVMGKDEETKYLKERQALYAERQNYINKRTSIFEEMKALQSNKTDAGTIQQERNELITKISQIKGRRQATTNLDDIRNEINSLKAQIQNVQTDLASLKGSGPMIQQPLRPLQTTR